MLVEDEKKPTPLGLGVIKLRIARIELRENRGETIAKKTKTFHKSIIFCLGFLDFRKRVRIRKLFLKKKKKML